mmetsp:Transcript_16876/g.33589  ORF Transcript_16876/g.33589 Transcript_16876/m.33589 type:complete len:254 (-) Transcript_16876:593-1354(-)
MPSVGRGWLSLTTHLALRLASSPEVSLPTLTLLSRSTNAVLSCLWTSFSTMISSTSSSHTGESKANGRHAPPSRDIGGSWKKSPKKITRIPPKGKSRNWPSFLTALATPSSVSRSSEDNMLHSSTIRTSWSMRRTASALLLTRPITDARDPVPSPIPKCPWSVLPPTLIAATPVGAHTATPVFWRRSSWTRNRSRYDLPVPAGPVTNAPRPSAPRIRSAARPCSAVRDSRAIGSGPRGGGGAANGAESEQTPA